MRILVVEDDQGPARYLCDCLEQHFPSFDILPVVDDLTVLADALTAKPDLLFLDIEVGNKNSIDEIVKQDLSINAEIIITSAHSKYALDGYNIHPYNYLLKPIDEDDLKEVVEQLLASRQKKVIGQQIKVKDKEGYRWIEIASILYFQAQGAYTRIVSQSGQYLSSKNLGHFESQLVSTDFVRVHHSYLINPKHLTKTEQRAFCIMSNGDKIPVSTRRRAELRKLIH